MKEEILSLTQSSEDDLHKSLDRRDFLRVSVGVGFAASVLPVAAQTMIETDTKGLTHGTHVLNVNGQDVPVYYARPEGVKNAPVILVISEIFGVHQHIADVARRFAHAGYFAVAPELFVRQGDARKYTVIGELIKEVISKVPDAQVMQDLDACLAWVKSQGGDVQRAGITGFCWGGRITWMYSAHNPSIKAGVAWYGRLVGESTPLTPRHPVDIAAELKVPVLGLYGAKDTGIPLDTVTRMEGELKKGQSRSEFKVFANSGHAFHADYRPSYLAEDAQEGWKRCLAWFKANGV